MKELRTDQAESFERLREAVGAGKRRIAMQAPPGFGKTVLAAAIVESARLKDKRVLFTVPYVSLIDQTMEMFNSQGIYEVGVIQASHRMTDWSQPVQIASVQTLQKRTLPQADVVLIDECHKWFSFYEKWLSKEHTPAWGNIPMIGLSATPWTRGLANYYDEYVRASTIQQLIDEGHLSKFMVYAPSHPDLSQVRTVAGDYHEGELAQRMSEGALVADVVDTWLRRAEQRPTLCFAVDRAHAKHLQLKFEAAGVPCGYQDAHTSDADRRKLRSDFHSGAVKVACNVGTLTTGVDWDVRCISMCRPTKSDMLFVQIVGRGLRTAPGKDHCLILDHSDNHLRLGFATDVDDSYTGLLAGKAPQHDNRTEGIRLPKECQNCAYLKPPRMALCPACGFTAQPVCGVKTEAGELRELKKKPQPKPVQPDFKDSISRKIFYAELKGVAIHKGYKHGWAANQYRERIGVWPSNDMRDVAPIAQTSMATLNWLKSRAIAWAKSKQGQAGPVAERML